MDYKILVENRGHYSAHADSYQDDFTNQCDNTHLNAGSKKHHLKLAYKGGVGTQNCVKVRCEDAMPPDNHLNLHITGILDGDHIHLHGQLGLGQSPKAPRVTIHNLPNPVAVYMTSDGIPVNRSAFEGKCK